MVPLAEAAKRVMAALADFGMRPELTDLGRGGEPTAWSCRMRTGDGGAPATAQGMGKGRRDEARIGAVFEALEHYLTGPDLFDPSAVELVGSARLAAGPLRHEACSVLLGRTPARRLACHRYRPLGGGPEILVPLFLSAPWYLEAEGDRLREQAADTCDYGDLMRYSCNSGSAIGVTAAEALLHAVNEAIERDALSLFLVRAFLGADGFRPTVIDPASLPGELASAYAAAERFTGSPVFLLDITSDLGVPSMLAYTAPAGGRPHRRGAGTSLSSTHAAWRALTELLQTTVGEALREPGDTPRGDLTGLTGHPALYACGRFDLTDHLRGARAVPCTPAGRLPDPAAQLRRLIAILAAHGHPPYARTVATLRAEITAVHVLVPGLERFMLITGGNLVVPGPRGRAAVRDEQP
ncbi:YcaO-like family protein [Actinomadura alba]|uniref:YcaO-like family protein n=1 Tax=Actinomadura alba TaxID=406431 RepID=A0ABR7LR79_9ACTN|nr:YcaO-like family protein [Actinomadura alba]